jgi:general stress protein YciG
MDTKQILTDLRTERDRIDRAISALEGLDGAGALRATAPGTQTPASQPRGRRKMSPAGRKRMSEAAKKRWAERRATTVLISQAAPKKSSGRRTVSAASRKKMAEAQRKRWAARKKAAKT